MEAIKKIWQVVISCLTIIVGLLAVFFVGTRILGYKPYTVLSSSMNPSYKIGDLVFAKRVKFSDINEGDVLVFMINGQTTVTHRVVHINQKEEFFTTRGDANNIEDGNPVFYSNVVGVVKFSIPKLGFVSIFIMRFGAVPIIMITIAFVLCYEVIKKIIILNKEGNGEV